jgi:hypothetical protein
MMVVAMRIGDVYDNFIILHAQNRASSGPIMPAFKLVEFGVSPRSKCEDSTSDIVDCSRYEFSFII